MSYDAWITWDGSRWRSFLPSDLTHHDVLRAPFIRATCAMNPRTWVVTLKASQEDVTKMHDRWSRENS